MGRRLVEFTPIEALQKKSANWKNITAKLLESSHNARTDQSGTKPNPLLKSERATLLKKIPTTLY
ncbi:hypothetical protein ACNKHW_07130 [Shigella flexneri]